MLRNTFTWVGDNSEFCDLRARAMQGRFTHKGMHTHMYNSQTLSNDGNWEIMSTYKSHILDSEFHFSPKNYWSFWEKLLIPWQVQGKNEMSLVYLLQKASNRSKNDGKISKGQRAWIKEGSTFRGWNDMNNMNIKINNYSDRS